MGVKVFCKCSRCNGKGVIKAFSHVQAGVCFGCRLSSDALTAPGDQMVEFSFEGNKVLRDGGRVYLRTSDLAKLSRKAKIDAAAKEFARIDNERGPHGLSFVELVALARVSDKVLADRILKALRERVAAKNEESAEVEGLVQMFGLAEAPAASV